MINIALPNGPHYEFRRVVFDYNGTLAEEGIIADGVRRLLTELTEIIPVTVITADTFGLARSQLAPIPNLELIILHDDMTGTEKAHLIREWGAEHTIAVGNGVNDQPMFFAAGLKICILGPEGASAGLLAAANIVVGRPEDAIRLLLNPQRLIATLRP